MSQRHQSVWCKPVLHIRGFAIVQTTWDDIYAILRDRQSGGGVEPLTFELETEEPNPLAITAKEVQSRLPTVDLATEIALRKCHLEWSANPLIRENGLPSRSKVSDSLNEPQGCILTIMKHIVKLHFYTGCLVIFHSNFLGSFSARYCHFSGLLGLINLFQDHGENDVT